jgi:exopolyphosphatase / guanosine-5'-triphosphate,3'-diphosphate pyrophosphatase
VRVAAVDLGTNTTRLLVADVEHGLLDPIVRREAITQLGESVDRRRILLPIAIARVRNVLVDYRREAEALGAERVLAVGTSAVRDADNGEAFLGEVEWSYGFVTRLLDGGEEAELMLRGVASDLTLGAGTLVIDIGGGSTELVCGARGELDFHISTQIGVVRHTERHLPSDPPTAPELAALAADVDARVAAAVPADVRERVRAAVAVAGTATSCAAIDLALDPYDTTKVEGHLLSHAKLEALLARLAAIPVAERRRVTGLDPDRAPTIVAGVVILTRVVDAFGLGEVEVSDRDILWGVAIDRATGERSIG